MSDTCPQHPVHFWRYSKPYVAWFCTTEGAKQFMAGASDLGQIAGESTEPFSLPGGIQFEDIGHEHCFGDENYHCAHDEQAEADA